MPAMVAIAPGNELGPSLYPSSAPNLSHVVSCWWGFGWQMRGMPHPTQLAPDSKLPPEGPGIHIHWSHAVKQPVRRGSSTSSHLHSCQHPGKIIKMPALAALGLRPDPFFLQMPYVHILLPFSPVPLHCSLAHRASVCPGYPAPTITQLSLSPWPVGITETLNPCPRNTCSGTANQQLAPSLIGLMDYLFRF
jgi:hypothetical protein